MADSGADAVLHTALTVYAYLLERPGGNALFYNPGSPSDFQAIADLGGITRQYLSTCHGVDEGLVELVGRFDPKLCCHARVEPNLATTMPAASYFDSQDRELHAGDGGVIHTLGRTDNNVCYRHRSPHGEKYLFTGDSFYLNRGEWATIVVSQDGRDRRDLADSPAILRTLDGDVVICSVSIGGMRIVEVEPREWSKAVGNLMRPLVAG